MKFWDIVKTVGTEIVESVVPGGGAIITVVNELLPEGSKLPRNATGEQLQSAVMALPADAQVQILSKEFDVDLTQIRQSHKSLQIMLENDAKNPQTTRPKIALGAFHVLAFCVLVVISTWSYSVFADKSEMTKAVMDGWPFVVAIITPLVTLLYAYFGILKQEKRAVLDASNKLPTTNTITSLISRLVK